MAVQSKVFFPPLSNILGSAPCKDVFHRSNPSCNDEALNMLLNGLKGSAKFFLPIYLVQVLVKWKALTPTSLLDDVKAFIRSLSFGTSFITSLSIMMCLVRKIYGGYSIYVTLLIPSLISGCTVFIEKQKRQKLLSIYFITMVMETLFAFLEQYEYINISRVKKTFMFMCVNAVLMYLYRRKKKNAGSNEIDTWFFQPPLHSKFHHRKENDLNKINYDKLSKNNICPHRDTCLKYIFKCTGKYTAVGIAIQFFKRITSRFESIRKRPSSLIPFVFNEENFRLGIFLGSYISIYWVTHCFLCHFIENDYIYSSVISGFLSGISYYIYPNLFIGFSALSTMLAMLFKYLVDTKALPRVPKIDCILFIISFSVLLHFHIFCDDSTSKTFKAIVRTISCGRYDENLAHFHGVIKNFYLKQSQMK